MKRTVIALVLSLLTTAASADSLRSDRHFVKIDVQKLSETSRQYDVQVFDAATRTPVARLQVSATGDTPEEAETTSGGALYKVRIQPHGASYLIDFSADDGTEVIDSMRGGFVQGTTSMAPPAPPAPVRAGRDIEEPKVLRSVEPVYTEDARAAGAAGAVVLELLIDRSGFVREATVVKRMGYGLDEAAADAVKQWQFAPSMQERVPVEVSLEVTIDFRP